MSRMPYGAVSIHWIKRLMLNTLEFLSTCRSDILCQEGPLLDDPRKITVRSTHRIAYDFLMADEMSCLNALVPSHLNHGTVHPCWLV